MNANTQELEPYCRICYESNEEPRNPLMVPCGCRGSLRHIHRKCLLRWVVGNSEQPPETVCRLCEQPYAVPPIHRLETIPRDGDTRSTLLRNPVILVLIVHYLLAAFLNAVPQPLRKMRFAAWATVAHAVIHILYLALFLFTAKTRNTVSYIYTWLRYYSLVPGFHWLLYRFYSAQTFEIGYLADLWLGVYWFVHLRILRSINDAILR